MFIYILEHYLKTCIWSWNWSTNKDIWTVVTLKRVFWEEQVFKDNLKIKNVSLIIHTTPQYECLSTVNAKLCLKRERHHNVF